MSDRDPILLTRADAARLKAWKRADRRFWDGYSPYGPRVALLVSFAALHAAGAALDARRRPLWAAILGARSDEALRALGGRDRALVADGEVWRLVTAGFLHGDLLHLVVNSVALAGLGGLAEAVWGPGRALWVFVASVVGGNLASQLGPASLSIGASGGIFGLMGGLGAFGLRHGRSLAPELRAVFSRNLWPWVGLNLGIGLLLPFVDNPAHFGGLLTGAALGAVLDQRITHPAGPLGGRAAAAAALGTIALAFGGLMLGGAGAGR